MILKGASLLTVAAIALFAISALELEESHLSFKKRPHPRRIANSVFDTVRFVLAIESDRIADFYRSFMRSEMNDRLHISMG
jgi:hypothetical protein